MTNPADYLRQLFSLENQVAVVIGGTGVLGGALAEGIALAGAKVIVSGRDPDKGNQRVEQLTKLGATASYIQVDVFSRASMENLLAKTLAEYGRVDLLVNCAGTNSATPYAELTDDDWNRVIGSQLTATHLGCQIFARELVKNEQGGAILNIGSVTAHLPLSRVFAYSAAKAAVVNLTQNLAREFAPQKVRVNAICPGFFPAEQNRKILDAERVANIMRGTPMNRFGEPQELIGAALLLLSRNAGSYITGATYYVDGGFTAMRF